MADAMYRIGDFVFCEDDAQSHSAYSIRRIDEIMRSDDVFTLRVVRYYRRSELPSTLVRVLENVTDPFPPAGAAAAGELMSGSYIRSKEWVSLISAQNGARPMTEAEFIVVKNREVFASKQCEYVSQDVVRGRCFVFPFLDKVQSLTDILGREDTFFYRLRYDPVKQELDLMRSVVRVGPRFQVASVPERSCVRPPPTELRERPLFLCDAAGDVSESEMGSVVSATQAAGMLHRTQMAVECGGSVLLVAPPPPPPPHPPPQQQQGDERCCVTPPASPKPGVGGGVGQAPLSDLFRVYSSATRDASLTRAFGAVHAAGYDVRRAMVSLFPSGGGAEISHDQLSRFSPNEVFFFERSMRRFGKRFDLIQNRFLAWKPVRSLVEFYYLYKGTDRYRALKVDRKREAVLRGAGDRLKQVFIPPNARPHACLLSTQLAMPLCVSCESTRADGWYRVVVGGGGVANAVVICEPCWRFLKAYGHFKTTTTGAGPAAAAAAAAAAVVVCLECGRRVACLSALRDHLFEAHGHTRDEIPATAANANANADELCPIRESFAFIPTNRMRILRALEPLPRHVNRGTYNLAEKIENRTQVEAEMASGGNLAIEFVAAALVRAESGDPTEPGTGMFTPPISRQQREIQSLFERRSREVEEDEDQINTPRMRLLPEKRDELATPFSQAMSNLRASGGVGADCGGVGGGGVGGAPQHNLTEHDVARLVADLMACHAALPDGECTEVPIHRRVGRCFIDLKHIRNLARTGW